MNLKKTFLKIYSKTFLYNHNVLSPNVCKSTLNIIIIILILGKFNLFPRKTVSLSLSHIVYKSKKN